MSAKNGGVQTPPPHLSAKNQKLAYPPHPLSEKNRNLLPPLPPMSEIIFCCTPTNEVKPSQKEEIYNFSNKLNMCIVLKRQKK